MQLILKFVPVSLVIFLDLLYIINCLSPYLGIKYQFSQAMYSYLGYHGENHLFFPRLDIFKNDEYVNIKDLEVSGVETQYKKDFVDFVNWTQSYERSVHLDFLQYHFNKLCVVYKVDHVSVTYLTQEGKRINHINVCEEEAMLSYFPSYLYPACSPNCKEKIFEWARGQKP